MNILKYKEYEGTAEVDATRLVCRGKILFIDDLVTYEAPSPAELQKEFELAVDDYLETCAEIRREPCKSLKGSFNVRVSPELHRLAATRGVTDDVSLNEVVVRALRCYLTGNDVTYIHNVKVTVTADEILQLTSDFPKSQGLYSAHSH